MSSIEKFYKNKNILITGITGFKGSWLASWLSLLGSKIYGISKTPNKNINLFQQLELHKRVVYKNIDICNIKELNNFINFSKPQIIFHLAAQPLIAYSYTYPLETFKTNILGTANILEIFRKNKFIKSLICVTSDKCYEDKKKLTQFKEGDRLGGIDPYSTSKACAEIIARSYQKSFSNILGNNRGLSTARAGNVIGGGDWSQKRLIPDCIRSLLKNKKIIIRNPTFNRPWQHVMDPIHGYLMLAMKQYTYAEKFSGAWNFGPDPKSLKTVEKVVRDIVALWGSGSFIFKKSKFYEQKNLQLNISKSKKELGWKPVLSMDESIFKTIDWYLRVYKKKEDPITVTNNQIIDFINAI